MQASSLSATTHTFVGFFLVIACVHLGTSSSQDFPARAERAERLVRNEIPRLERSILTTELNEELTDELRQQTGRLVDVIEVTEGGVKVTAPGKAIVERVSHPEQFRVAVDRSSGAMYRLRGFHGNDVVSFLSDLELRINDSRSALLGAELAVLVALPGYFVRPVANDADNIDGLRGLLVKLDRPCRVNGIRTYLDSSMYRNAGPSLIARVKREDRAAPTWKIVLSVLVGNACSAEIREVAVRFGPDGDLEMSEAPRVWRFPDELIADCDE